MFSAEFSAITVAVLAGGFGTRLRSVISDRQKVLAEIGGRPFLTYLFDQLASFYINHVVLCTGYRGDQIKKILGNSYKSLMITYSQESTPLGTAGALRNAYTHFASDHILVLNGDSFYETDIAAFWNWHTSKKAFCSVLLTEVDDTSRYGRVETDEQGVIVQFSEKGKNTGPGLINAGIYLMNKRLVSSIPTGKRVSLEQEMFPRWSGNNLYGCRSEGRFIDIGTPEDYAKAEHFFTKGRYHDHQ
jgi:D-glycero-alpha-D-manno-heptose 1-phosphate guanylyltransferase